MRRAVALCLTLVVALGCERRSVTSPKPPGISAEILDGAHGSGNSHFFFLPPMVAQPSFSGTLNPNLGPTVQICTLAVTTTGTACDPAVVPIDPGPMLFQGDHYQVNWNTGATNVSTSNTYRIQVFVANQLLGFADVQPVTNGSALKNLRTGDIIGLVDGRTLPIKVRIELGAFGTNCVSDCAEASVTNAGGTVVTNTGFAGVQLPAGWLASPSQVIVTIERVTTINGATINDAGSARCIPLAASVAPNQFEGCYRFQTLPTATFANFVTVGICAPVETLSEADLDAIQLYSVEEPVPSEGAPVIRALPNVPAPFVSCAGFTSTPLPTGLLRSLPGRLLQQLVRLVEPPKAYAFHLGVGGSTCCFSRIGWVLAATTPINFDVGPSGTIEAGTAVNTVYSNEGVINDATVGVTFSRTTPSALCGDANVYANDHGPLPGGGFGFNSGNNVVTICPEGTASDFSESSGGRIVASFTGTVTQACLQVYVTGFQPGSQPGATGFLEAFDANGVSLGQTTSTPNAFGQSVCVNATASATIASVQFAGSGSGFAIFDNMTVRFAQAPPPILPVP